MTGVRLVKDRHEYCYFGDTGATRGLAMVLGLGKEDEAGTTVVMTVTAVMIAMATMVMV